MPRESVVGKKPKSTTWSPRARFEYILRAYFGGSQSSFAKALGCTQGAISKVTGGRQSPGPRLLLALASLEGLDRKWALLGEGSPPDPDRPAVAKLALPVMEEFPAGKFRKRDLAKAGEFRAVGLADFSATRFFIRASKNLVPVTLLGSEFQAGDLLLVETDAAFWKHDLNRLDGRFCLARSPATIAPGVSVTRIAVKPSAVGHSATLVAVDFSIGQPSITPPSELSPRLDHGGQLRRIVIPSLTKHPPSQQPDRGQPHAEQDEPRPINPTIVEVMPKEIFGVVVQLLRSY
jgi:transcriptional regulator with XRE-family HTH domain